MYQYSNLFFFLELTILSEDTTEENNMSPVKYNPDLRAVSCSLTNIYSWMSVDGYCHSTFSDVTVGYTSRDKQIKCHIFLNKI